MANDTSINVHISRKETVSTDVVAKIASEFLEWIDSQIGEFSIPDRIIDTYEELGIQFAQWLTEHRDGQLR